MKYNHILLITVIISSMISGMEIKHSSSRSKKTLKYHKKTTLFISHAIHKDNDIFVTLDRNGVLNMSSKTKGPHRSSPSKNKLNRYEQVT